MNIKQFRLKVIDTFQKISSKLLLGFLSLTIIPLFFIGVWMISNLQNKLEKSELADFFQIAASKEKRITDYFEWHIRDIKLVENDNDLVKSLTDISAVISQYGRDSEAYNEIEHHYHNFFNFHIEELGYRNLMLVNMQGEVLYSHSSLENPNRNLLQTEEADRPLAEIYKQAISEQQVVVSNYHYDKTVDLECCYMSMPIVQHNQAFGVLVVQLALDDLLGFFKDHSDMGETGEVLLGKISDDKVYILSPPRFGDARDAKTVISLGDDFAVPMQNAVQYKEGYGISTDLRGVEVIAVWNHLESPDLGLVVKADAAEVYKMAQDLKRNLLLTLMVILLVALMMTYFLTRSITIPLKSILKGVKKVSEGHRDYLVNKGFKGELGELAYSFDEMSVKLREKEFLQLALTDTLKKSEENLNVTLDSIGDAIIATDENRFVVRMNPVAEALTGWSFVDAEGKTIDEVFVIVHAETRQIQPNPVTHVLATNKIQELANHTVLVSKDGREHHIADAAAPIRNNKDQIIGVILNFRDVTESYRVRKELYEKEQSLRNLFEGSADAFFIFYPDNGTFMDCNDAGVEVFAVKSKADIIGSSVEKFFPEKQPGGENSTDLAFNYVSKTLLDGKSQFEFVHKRANGEEFYSLVSMSIVQYDNQEVILGSVRDMTQQRADEQFNRLAIAREERIVELKNEVNSLLVDRGDEGIYNPSETFVENFPEKEGKIAMPSLDELLAGNDIQETLDEFCHLMGVGALIGDTTGGVFYSSNFQKACTQFHRKNKITCANCIESDTQLAHQLKGDEDYHVYKCKNGLTDAAAPVIVNGQHIADVLAGQFFTEAPDLEFFREQAQRVGFDEPKYIEAIKNVPIIAEEDVPEIMKYLVAYAKSLGLMAVDKLNFLQAENLLIEQRAAAFNLAEDAVRAKEELVKHQEQLEQTILERTAEIRESEENLAVTLNSIGDAIIATDQNRLVVRMNPVAEKLTGWTLGEAEGRNIDDVFVIVHAETRQPQPNPVTLVLATNEIQELANHTVLIAKGGEEYHIADAAAPIGNHKGDVIGVILNFRDVTEAYRVRDELSIKERNFRNLFEGSADALYIVSPEDGRFLDCNYAGVELFSVKSKEDLLCTSFVDFLPEKQPEGEVSSLLAFKHIKRALVEGKSKFQFVHKRANGEEFYSLLSVSRVQYDGEDVILASVRDVSQQKADEQFNRLAIAREERIVELKNEVNTLLLDNGDEAIYNFGDTSLPEETSTSTEDDIRDLADLLFAEDIQETLDRFCSVVGVGASIGSMQGKIQFKSNFQKACTHFHRLNKVTCANCVASDHILSQQTQGDKEYSMHKCKNGLVDAVSPVYVNGQPIANVFVGQFLTEEPDLEFFRQQAKEVGFNEEAYIQAIKEIPIITEEEVSKIMMYLTVYTKSLGMLSFEKMQFQKAEDQLLKQRAAAFNLAEDAVIAREELMKHKEQLEQIVLERTAQITESRQDLIYAQSMAHIGNKVIDFRTRTSQWSDEIFNILGLDPEKDEPSSQNYIDRIHPDDRDHVLNVVSSAIDQGTSYTNVYRIIDTSGTEKYVSEIAKLEFDSDGKPLKTLVTIQDITEQRKTEQELKKLNVLSDTALRLNKSGFWYVDYSEPDYYYPSAEIVEMLGYPPNESKLYYTQDDWSSHMIEGDEELARAANQAYLDSLKGLKKFDVTYKYKRPIDGVVIWVRSTGELVKDDEGNNLFMYGVKQDVTEQKMADAEVVQSKDRLQTMIRVSQYEIENVKLFLDHVQLEALVLTQSKLGYLAIYDHKKESFILNSWSGEEGQICTSIDDVIEQQWQQVGLWEELLMQQKSIIVNECSTIAKDGQPSMIDTISVNRLMSVPVFSNGKMAAIVGVANKETDYSEMDSSQLGLMMRTVWKMVERFETSQKLEKAKEEMEEAATAANFGMWDWNPISDELYTNDTFETMLGYAAGTFPNVTAKWLDLVHPEDIGWVNDLLNDKLAGETGEYRCEYRMKSSDGEWRWIQDVGNVAEYNDEGAVQRFMGFHIDINESKELQERLKSAKEEAESANVAKSAFLANMSHEIRTPMNAIIGFSEILSKDIKEPVQKKHLNSIKTSGRVLLGLINDILDISKIEAGSFNIQKEVVSLKVLFNEIDSIFSLKIEEKGLHFKLTYDPGIPDFMELDEQHLRQVVINLVSNSYKFTDTGYIELKVESTPISKNRVHLRMSIIDTGIGVSEADQLHIFEAFKQVEDQDTRKYGGTGLGLAISTKMVELMGGTISLESEVGKGSTFSIDFPDVVVIESYGHEDAGAFKYQPQELDFKKATLLLVDDVIENREVVKGYLQMYDGLEIVEADNGEVAVKLAEELVPDLILMDLRMPVMDGYAATEYIKQIPACSHIPIIAVTASAFITSQEEIKSRGFSAYVRKPFQIIEFVNIIANYLPFEEIEMVHDSTLQKDKFAITLPPDQVGDVASILEALNALKTDYWSKIEQTMSARGLKKFNTNLSVFNDKYNIAELIQYSLEIDEAIDSFDIQAMKILGTQFTKYIAGLEATFKSKK